MAKKKAPSKGYDPYNKSSVKLPKSGKKPTTPKPVDRLFSGNPRNQNYGKLFGEERTGFKLKGGGPKTLAVKSVGAIADKIEDISTRKGGTVYNEYQNRGAALKDWSDKKAKQYNKPSRAKFVKQYSAEGTVDKTANRVRQAIDRQSSTINAATKKASDIKKGTYKLGTLKPSGGAREAAKDLAKGAKNVVRKYGTKTAAKAAGKRLVGAALGAPAAAGLVGYDIGTAIYEAKGAQILDSIESFFGKKAYDPNDGKKFSDKPKRKSRGLTKGF